MPAQLNSQDYFGMVGVSLAEPWDYIGAAAGYTQYFSAQVGESLTDALATADQVRQGLLSDAQRFATARQLWSDLASGLSYELSGLRSRLDQTRQVWADKAIDALQNVNVLNDLVQARTPSQALSATLEFGRQLGGIVAAAQLIAELSTEPETSGPSVSDVTKAVLGVGAGLLVTLIGGVSLPWIGIGLAVGFAVDFSYNYFSSNEVSSKYISSEFKNAKFWDIFYSHRITSEVAFQINSLFRSGLVARRPPGDPLALDLDGDGLETVGIGTAPVLFDHNADGIRTGTGWVRGDDAWLALDRNANGLIDSGRELFGVDTLITNANGTVRTARDGFEALRTLDDNADGVFDASDAAFASVRVWRDVNQDGINREFTRI